MFEHRTANIFIDSEEVVWFKYKDGIEITIEDSKEYVKIINAICAGKRRCFILDTRGVLIQPSNEHRAFMVQNKDALKWRIADAILVDNLPNSILSYSYKNNFSNLHPIKIFKDEEEAKHWLKQIVKQKDKAG